ncbi:hypothetical protein CEXT_436571 [Caerostris extrusa]|uniref:Uncharacterized protein n=1 Tax=Caerostris extrusa TaxID=172846 RepID=A0AAV4M699_CAEEX|nr:hypothetical protein CEXT_436571 [Caerostris extrusa]
MLPRAPSRKLLHLSLARDQPPGFLLIKFSHITADDLKAEIIADSLQGQFLESDISYTSTFLYYHIVKQQINGLNAPDLRINQGI